MASSKTFGASSVPGSLVDQINRTKGVIQAATALITGFKTKLDAAVALALENGATEAELAPLVTLAADLDISTTELAQAVSANS